jgi:hypothetical protein
MVMQRGVGQFYYLSVYYACSDVLETSQLSTKHRSGYSNDKCLRDMGMYTAYLYLGV